MSWWHRVGHGSKNLFHRAILYRHKKILLCQGRLQAQTQENNMGESGGFSSISQDWSIRLSSRLVWYQISSVRFLGIQRGHQENPYEKDWAVPRSVHLMEIWHNSWLEDVRHAKMDFPGFRDTRHGSKNWPQRAILHRHKKIWVCQGRLQAESRWNYLWFVTVFH